MALIVEDGTGRADAQSLCSVSDADAYHQARGNAGWADIDMTAKEQALVRATAYMQQFYGMRWAGYRINSTQALAWPRYEVPMRDFSGCGYYASNAVPADVRNACAELALTASTTTLAPNVGRLKQSVSIGPIDVTYAPGSSASTKYRAVDGMLAPFLRAGGGSSIPVVRA